MQSIVCNYNQSQLWQAYISTVLYIIMHAIIWLYVRQQIVKVLMKQQPPSPELRLFLANICSTHELSLQTYHNTMSILMSPALPQLANQDKDVCMAALVISQKLHEKYPVPVHMLCDRSGLSLKAVLAMELLILKQLRYRVAVPLLVDACMQIAHGWDTFVKQVSCIKVRFFGQYQPAPYQQTRDNQPDKQNINPHNQSKHNKSNINQSTHRTADLSTYGHNKYNTCAYNNLIETCQKLAYCIESTQYDQYRLGLAIVGLCIKQAERHHYNTNYYYGTKGKAKINKLNRLKKHNTKSTDIIISDFAHQLYAIDYQNDLKQEIEFITLHNFGLKDISHRISNFKNVEHVRERSLISKFKRYS